jgi:hypothetical protein
MGMPSKFKGFINDREWNRLALHQLRPDFRNSIMEAMAGGFDAMDQHDPPSEAIQLVLDLAQDDADNMREISRLGLGDASDEEIASAMGMAAFIMQGEDNLDKEVQREMADEAKRREAAKAKKKEAQAAKKAERAARKKEEEKNRSPYGGKYQ